MPTSPPESTDKSAPRIPETEELALLDLLQLETSGPSVATEEGASGSNPWEQTPPRMPCDPTIVATSSQAEKAEGNRPQDPGN